MALGMTQPPVASVVPRVALPQLSSLRNALPSKPKTGAFLASSLSIALPLACRSESRAFASWTAYRKSPRL
jgi:hypothetical protein